MKNMNQSMSFYLTQLKNIFIIYISVKQWKYNTRQPTKSIKVVLNWHTTLVYYKSQKHLVYHYTCLELFLNSYNIQPFQERKNKKNKVWLRLSTNRIIIKRMDKWMVSKNVILDTIKEYPNHIHQCKIVHGNPKSLVEL